MTDPGHPPQPAVVTPGNHDGVHLGHQALVRAAKARADAEGLRTVALFFDPHPSQVLAPDRAPPLLTTPGRRRELLEGVGADEAVAWPFDRAFASLSPEAFVERVLVERFAARGVVVGPDFRFGKRRAGDLATLRELGERHGFGVEVVEPVEVGEERVSSTRVRTHLGEGDVEGASRLLGRAHDVTGTVTRGDQRGRTIGFPTANLDCEPVVLPLDGVYAVVVRRLDHPGTPLLGGVANLGIRPTFDAGRAVEAHLFDFDGDLYGERLRVGFVKRIRPEMKFDGLAALEAQIAEDAAAARRAVALTGEELVRWV